MVVVVVVARVVVRGSFGLSELLGSGGLGLGVQVLNLGLTEDAGAGSVGVLCIVQLRRPSLHPGVA